MSVTQRRMTADEYSSAAWEYYQTLPMEHFMEATPQATQREIALASFALLKSRRPHIQYFSELLVQYWFEGELCRVVPDNMLVISNEPDRVRSSFATELESASPFMMFEWVSDSSEGKDYGESFRKYGLELRTPYCLCFHPAKRKWEAYGHDGQRYVQLEANLNGRVEIPELNLEIGLDKGWIRFWYEGQLLEIPAELQKRLEHQSEQISQQSEQIQQLRTCLADVVERLRRLVERRAKKAGRQDILDELHKTDNIELLERWLNDLE